MPLRLAAEEPEAGPFRAEPLTAVFEALTQRSAGRSGTRRPVVLAIDGRRASGKTTNGREGSITVPAGCPEVVDQVLDPVEHPRLIHPRSLTGAALRPLPVSPWAPAPR